jgi:poly(hydroxyalkanoate) depolymerase family esterase
MSRVFAIIIVALCFFQIEKGYAFERADILKVPTSPPSPMLHGEFTHQGLTKGYMLFSPPQTGAAKKRPLLVMLHGCLQNAEDFAALTKINELAIRENFFVVFPEQDTSANAMSCWSWFEPINQDPTLAQNTKVSERDWIAALTQSLSEKIEANQDAVFVAGLSAGGAMAVNLASCYPETFAGVAVFSGISFAAAGSVLEATKVMKLGSDVSAHDSANRAFHCAQAKTGKAMHAFVFHGKADLTVSSKNARQVLNHFIAFNDLRDDGLMNSSAKFDLKERRKIKASRKTRGYISERYATENQTQAELVVVNHLGHVWSGGAEGSDFSSTKKPEASEMLWNFISRVMASRP